MAIASDVRNNDDMSAPLQFQGELLAIGVADKAKDPIQLRDSVEVVEGAGIVGDRYYECRGAGQKRSNAIQPEQHVTLIAAEAIEEACHESGLPITHSITRRNLLVRGVPLNDLVNQTFRVGEVVLQGLEPCDPCSYLEKQTFPHIKQALLNRGGLRTCVLAGGTIRVGDAVTTQQDRPAAADS